MQNNQTPKEERIWIIGDSGYQCLSKYFAGADECVPFKNPKGKELSKTKECNKVPFKEKDKD